MNSFDGVLSCANCAKSLEEGYYPIRMSGERMQFVCSEACGRKWMEMAGEIFQCHQCKSECPISEHPAIEWNRGETYHFCKDDCVFDYMAENGVTYVNPEAQPDVEDQ